MVLVCGSSELRSFLTIVTVVLPLGLADSDLTTGGFTRLIIVLSSTVKTTLLDGH